MEEWGVKLKTMKYYDREVIGDASETALVKFFQPFGDILEVRDSMKVAKQFDDTDAIIGFNSAYKYALNVFELPNDSENSHVVWIKGAPERIWKKCGNMFMDCLLYTSPSPRDRG